MRVLRAALAAVLPVTLFLYTAPLARANGRFPKAQAIALPPGGDGSTIYLRATFGVLVSRDAGATWRWLCEQALGFSSTWDPPIAVTRDGRLWIALADGARVTRDGCAVDDVAPLRGELVADFAVDGSGAGLFAVTSTPGKRAYVWRMAPASGTFARLGEGIAGFRFDTIEVAPSNPARLYLTATPEGKGTGPHLFRSDDGGRTIAELSPLLPNDGRLFVSAVDPRDPDRVYVRQLSETGSEVLLSTDGGKNLTRVLHMNGAMFGFARTPDGATVLAGSGDPSEGIWRSTDRGATWQAGAKTSVFCLNADGPALLVCSNPYTPGGYAMAESRDRGATVKPLATFDDVTGPIACDAGTSACDAAWPETRAAIATSARVRPPTIGPAPAVDAGPVDAGPTPPRAPTRACGCVIVGGARDDGAGVFVLAGLALVVGAVRGSQVWIARRPGRRRT